MGMQSIPGADATGEFLARQSSLNIALGLIMVFVLSLAGAVKKKKDQEAGNSRSGGFSPTGASASPTSRGSRSSSSSSRPSVTKPDVSVSDGADQKSVEEGDKETAQNSSGNLDNESKGQQDNGSSEQEGADSGSHNCSVCGEGFETPSGKKLHEKAVH
ncbi:MAG: hypothetical protein BRC26_01215 [Nanohaloarchaea archaeon QH_8_44_6]|nr:MAG: hypothetical protein BRC26_01215 [Nanohaloarchaea archaeon QH_8_44_6]